MTDFEKSDTLHLAKQKKGPQKGPFIYHLIKVFIIFYDF
jgi:hypothetical protein